MEKEKIILMNLTIKRLLPIEKRGKKRAKNGLPHCKGEAPKEVTTSIFLR